MRRKILWVVLILAFSNVAAKEMAKIYLLRPMKYSVYGVNNYNVQHVLEIDGHQLGNRTRNAYYCGIYR